MWGLDDGDTALGGASERENARSCVTLGHPVLLCDTDRQNLLLYTEAGGYLLLGRWK